MLHLEALVEQQRFGAALFTVQGYLRGVEDSAGALLDIHDSLAAIVAAGRQFVASFRAILLTPDLPKAHQEALLVSAEMFRAALADVLERRTLLLRVHPEATPFWPESLADEMADVLEDLEDLVETMALGLSAEFRAQIAAARAAAGLPAD